MFKPRFFLFLLLCLPVSFATAAESSAEERGLEIAREVDQRDQGYHDITVNMTMLLKNRQGEESLRYLKTKILEVPEDGDKSLIVFNRPRDVKGTALLTFSHKQKADDQWLFLPALKRVKRIASRNKSGPFMGSEFAYEDMSSQEIEKYTYRYIRDDVLDGKPVFVIERYPVDRYSGYKRQVVQIDRERYIPLKVDYYDRKNSLLKTLTFIDYHQYLNKHWRADKWFMENHQTGKTTLLTNSDYQFKKGLNDRDFTKNSLKRAH